MHPEVLTPAKAKALGLKRYFTGLECKHGHIAERLVSNGVCLECASIRLNEWRANNPDKAEAHRKSWAAKSPENREKHKAAIARWKEANKDSEKQRKRLSHAANREERIKSMRKWAKENPGRAAEIKRRWHENNQEKVIASRQAYEERNPKAKNARYQTRRAKLKSAPGKHTGRDIEQILVLQRYKCAVCRCDIHNNYHIDHIYPLSKGGSNDRTNLQALCPTCNLRKHAADPIDFMQQKGFLL